MAVEKEMEERRHMQVLFDEEERMMMMGQAGQERKPSYGRPVSQSEHD